MREGSGRGWKRYFDLMGVDYYCIDTIPLLNEGGAYIIVTALTRSLDL